MKFGKELRETVDQSYEEWRPMFMSYKTLKKRIKQACQTNTSQQFSNQPSSSSLENSNNHSPLVSSSPLCYNEHSSQQLPPPNTPITSTSPSSLPKSMSIHSHYCHTCNDNHPQVSQHTSCRRVKTISEISLHNDNIPSTKNFSAVAKAETEYAHFFNTFRAQVDKVNDFFLDKQEDYIIQCDRLRQLVNEFMRPSFATRAQTIRLKQRLTDFHAHLILLENFSTVNYTGFRKILKKFDKKTHLNMQHIYLNTVLITPFFNLAILHSLIARTESFLHRLNSLTKFRRSSHPDDDISLGSPIKAGDSEFVDTSKSQCNGKIDDDDMNTKGKKSHCDHNTCDTHGSAAQISNSAVEVSTDPDGDVDGDNHCNSDDDLDDDDDNDASV